MKRKLSVIICTAILMSLSGICGVHADAVSAPEAAAGTEAEAGIGKAVEESDKDDFPALKEEDKLEVFDPETEEATDKGFSSIAGVLEEYAVYQTYTGGGTDEYALFYFDISSRIVSCYVDILDLSKAFYSYDKVVNLDLNSLIYGFSSMSFADAYILDCGDFYRVMIYFEDLTNPDNVYALAQSGVIRMDPGYSKGALIDGDNTDALYKATGAYRLSDYEVSMIGLQP